MTVTRWSWLGDPLAIDLANTVRRRGWRYHELITSPADLRDWLAHERGRLTIPAEVGPVLLTRFVLIRDPVLRVLRAAAAGATLPAADVPLSTTRPPPPRPSGCSAPGPAAHHPAVHPGRSRHPLVRRYRGRRHRPADRPGRRRHRPVRRPRLRPALPARTAEPAVVRPALRHPRPLPAPRRAKRPPIRAERVTEARHSELAD